MENMLNPGLVLSSYKLLFFKSRNGCFSAFVSTHGNSLGSLLTRSSQANIIRHKAEEEKSEAIIHIPQLRSLLSGPWQKLECKHTQSVSPRGTRLGGWLVRGRGVQT